MSTPVPRRRRNLWLVLGAVVLAGGVAALIAALGAERRRSGTPAARDLAVLPFPGTPDASPQARITFPTLKPSDIVQVSVRGSATGEHAGHIVHLPADGGASFVPDHPFADRERVSVRARLASAAAARSAGAPRPADLRFDFSVAAPIRTQPAPGPLADPLARTQVFRSRPDLRPPIVTTSGRNPDASAGDIVLDAQAVQPSGPEILDAQGSLIWFSPLRFDRQAFNVQVQRYRGQPVLTYFQGRLVAAHGVGENVILDRSYRAVATVRAGSGYAADLHEFLLTDRGTALITVYVPVRVAIGGGREGRVLDGIVQEVDVRTGQVLWEWHALGHVPLSDSEQGRGRGRGAYDFFHINSIQELPDGNLVISARNTWAIYEVSRRTGRIIWQLGGKHSSFKMGANTQFEWQHDARLGADGTMTLFDNAAGPREEKESRGLVLKLDTRNMRASLERSITHVLPLLAGSQGNLQLLPNGNSFVGWGSAPNFSEHDRSGHQIFSAHFPRPAQSYRAFRYPWTGQPSAPPDLAVSRHGADLTAYASWNGATNVARWELLGGPSPGSLSVLITARRTGFETAMSTGASVGYVSVRALDAAGHVLGVAKVVHSP